MSIDWSKIGPANSPAPTTPTTTAPVAPASPGSLTVPTPAAPDATNPFSIPAPTAPGAQKDLGTSIAGGIDQLGQTLFGRGNGSPLGGIPLLGDAVGAVGNLAHGMGTAFAVKPFEAVATAVSHVPLGWLPGGADENFNHIGEWAKTNNPEIYDQWQKVNAAANGDLLGGGNLRADFNMDVAHMMDDTQYNSSLGTTPELAMGREGIGSLGGAFTHAVQGFLGILGNTSQRLLGGAGVFDPGTSSATYEQQKDRFLHGGGVNALGVGDEQKAVFQQLAAGTITEDQARQKVETISKGGRNRVQEAASRMDLGLEVSDVEKQAVEAWQSGAWSEDHAQDFLVSHGQSITRNPIGQIGGSLVTDPLTYATIGAGSVAKAGKVGSEVITMAGKGATTAEKFAAADTAYEKLAVAVRLVQETPILGQASRISRGLIDPFGVYKPTTVQRATTNLLSDASLAAFDRAYGHNNIKIVEALGREFNKTPEMASAIASYTKDQAHLMVAIHSASTLLGEGMGEELAKTSVDDVIEPLVGRASRDAVTQLTDHMQSVAKNTFTAEEKVNLADRMSVLFGNDTAYWTKRLAKMPEDAQSALHAITYKWPEAEFEQARSLIDMSAYKGTLPVHDLTLMTPNTLDDIEAKDAVATITAMLANKETPDRIAAATAEWNRLAGRYPAMMTIGYAPGGEEQLQQLVKELDRQVDAGQITRRALDKELEDPQLRPIKDMLDRHSVPIDGVTTFAKADGLDPKPLMDEFGWSQAKVQDLLDHSEMMPTKMLEPLREIDRRAKPELSLHQDLGALQSDIEAAGGIKSPIIVWWDPKTGAAVVADGNHRLTVALEQGYETVPVVVETKPADVLAQAENVNSIAKLKAAPGAPTDGVLKPSEVFPGAKITPGVASVGKPVAAAAPVRDVAHGYIPNAPFTEQDTPMKTLDDMLGNMGLPKRRPDGTLPSEEADLPKDVRATVVHDPADHTKVHWEFPDGMPADAKYLPALDRRFSNADDLHLTAPDGTPMEVKAFKGPMGTLFGVPGSERPLQYVYRAVSEEDYQNILKTGVMKSDGRMNLSADEGTVASHRDPSWYLPGSLASDQPGEHAGRILKIKVQEGDGWHIDGRDSYIKTSEPVSVDRIEQVSPKLVKTRVHTPSKHNSPERTYPDDVEISVPRPVPDVPPVAGATVAPKQGFISVPEGTLPVGHGKIYKGDANQASGAPVRGVDVIAPDDPMIPNNVYHVSTNVKAVRRSGVLKASGQGGLGGDVNDQIVSMTISHDVAHQLEADMKLVSEAYHNPHPVAVFTAQAQAEGWGEKWLKSNLFTPKGRPAPVTQKYSVKDWQTAYFNMRPGKQNPLIFGEDLKNVLPSDIGIVQVPKANLKNGALLTNFDIDGRQGGLQEIRSYGDVSVRKNAAAEAATAAATPPVPPVPPAAIDIPALGETSKRLWKVGFRPSEDVAWGLKRNGITGQLAVDRAPTISHVVDAVPGRQRFSDTTRNVLGQIIGKSAAEHLNKPIDSIEAYLNTTRDVVTGRRLVNNIERRFERSTFDIGIPKPMSATFMQKAKDVAALDHTTIRGIVPKNLWHEIASDIPKNFRLADGSTLNIHIVMDHLLRAAEGDLRVMGVTSKMTQRMRNVIGGPENFMGQLTVTQYNRFRYAFNPTFIIQRVTDSIYYSVLYGVTPVGKGELKGIAARMQRIEENIGRTATGRDFSMDMPEFATRANFTDGIKDLMQQMGIREAAVGKIADAPNALIKSNMTNMLSARVGDVVKGALDNLAAAAEKDPAMKADMLAAGEKFTRTFEDWRRVYSEAAGRILNDNEVGMQYLEDMMNGWRRSVMNPDHTLDFKKFVDEGERFLPSDVGEMVSIKPEALAQELGYPSALAMRRDVMGHMEIVNGAWTLVKGESDLPRLLEDARVKVGAGPDYLRRLEAYIGGDWDSYWHQLSLPVGKGGLDITPHYAKQAQDVIAMWARNRGMDPWEYLSGVMATNIGPNDLNSSVGQLVTFLKSGAAKAPIEEWTKVFRSTLDTSAQQALIDEFEKAVPVETAIAAPKPGAFGIGTGGLAVPPAGYKAEAGYVYKVQTLAEARKGWLRRTGVQADADMRTVSGRPGEGVFRSKVPGHELTMPARSTTGLDRATRNIVKPDQIEMLDIHGKWVPVGPDPMDTIMAKDFPEVVRQRLAGIANGTSVPHENPEVEGYIQQFAKWYTETRAAALSESTRHDLKRLTEAADIAMMPTDQAIHFSRTHALVVSLLKDKINDAQNDVFRLAEAQTQRTVLERSLNHPLWGLYPASYMWGKVLPETVKFLAKNPYAATYMIADVQRAIAIQREYDHEMDDKVGAVDRSAGAFLLDYLTPSLPWSDHSARMSPLVRDVLQGKDLGNIWKDELATVSPQRWVSQVINSMNEVPGAIESLSTPPQTQPQWAKGLQSLGGGAATPTPTSGAPAPITGPTKASALAPLLDEDMGRLQSILIEGKSPDQ